MADEGAADWLNGPAIGNELSGGVSGVSVQAGAIHGDVHFHAASSPPVALPRQLLAPSAHFTNREAELAALDALLLGAAAFFVIVSGPGGVGKTALALRWAHEIQDRFPDGQLYVDLAGFGDGTPLDPGDALGCFLRALGVPPERVPIQLAEQAALYRSVTQGRSLLVVLDNAYSAAQVRVLLPAPSSTSAVVVTSRSRLVGLLPDGARMVEVEPLPARDAVALLGRLAGEERIVKERVEAERLVKMCGGLPIAVCVAAARLAARPRLSVSRLAGDFVDEGQRLGALSRGDGASVQRVFDASYRLLKPCAAALYRRLALHPGQDFSLGLVEATCSGGDDDPLMELIDANLIEELPEDRFRFHDLLRLHAQERSRVHETVDERGDVLLAIVEWYLAVATQADLIVTPYRRRLPYEFMSPPIEMPALPDRRAALHWLERERRNLIAAGRTALEQGWHGLAWHLCDVMWALFLYHKHYRDRLEVDRMGVRAAQAWGNAWAEADMLKRLGRVCTTAGRHEEAEQHLLRSIELCRGIEDRRGEADARETLALLRLDTGGDEEAAGLLAEVVAAHREMGRPRSLGLTLINLGGALLRLGEPQQARGLLLEAREIFAGMAQSDPYNGARTLVVLARAYMDCGDLGRAKRTAEEAAERMRQLGSQNGVAEALEALAEVAQREGDDVAARRWLGEALDLYSALGSPRVSVVRARVDEFSGDARSGEGVVPPVDGDLEP